MIENSLWRKMVGDTLLSHWKWTNL